MSKNREAGPRFRAQISSIEFSLTMPSNAWRKDQLGRLTLSDQPNPRAPVVTQGLQNFSGSNFKPYAPSSSMKPHGAKVTAGKASALLSAAQQTPAE
jgi:hypothetical protein